MDRLEITAAPTTSKYVADGPTSVKFRLVREESDIDKDQADFPPEMTHQFFGDNENIYGYSNLTVRLMLAASSLDIYLDLNFDLKITPSSTNDNEPDDIPALISKQFPEGCQFVGSIDKFKTILAQQSSYQPVGELIHSFVYEDPNDNKRRTFQIYHNDQVTPAFDALIRRAQFLSFWYIDAACYLDSTDPLWDYFVMYEETKTGEGSLVHHFVGYAAVYRYYAYPEHMRPRVGQILILPPFQRLGNGVQFLQTLYRHYLHNPKVVDITVEDPSENYTKLRDFVDCFNCQHLNCYQPAKLAEGFSKEMVTEARQRLKIPKQQARRVYEILRLKHTDAADPDAMKSYRLDVKRRLNIPYTNRPSTFIKMVSALTDEEKQAAMAVLISDPQRFEILQTSYDELVNEYRKTLNRLSGEPPRNLSPLVRPTKPANGEAMTNGIGEVNGKS